MNRDRMHALTSLMNNLKAPNATYWRAVRRAAQTRTDSPENDAAQARGNKALEEIDQTVRQWVAQHPDAEQQAHAAEVRAAALDDAADWLVRRYGVTNRAAGDLRRMAAAARPDDTAPAVGDRYDSRNGGAPVTVTRLWKLENGHPAVSFEWCDTQPGDDGSALPLDSFHRAYRPARPDDTRGA